MVGMILSEAGMALVLIGPYALPFILLYAIWRGLKRLKARVARALPGGKRRAIPIVKPQPTRPSRRLLPAFKFRMPRPRLPRWPVKAAPDTTVAVAEAAPEPAPLSPPAPVIKVPRYSPPQPSTPAPVEETGFSIGHIHSEGLGILKRQVPRQYRRAEVPWFLALGEASSCEPLLFAPGSTHAKWPQAGNCPCAWLFCEGGVILDVAGPAAAMADGEDGDWQALMEAFRKHPQPRPLDGVILFVDIDDLTDTVATALNRRLHTLQETLGTVSPVFIVMKGGERLDGFAEFRALLPDAMVDGLFGWSATDDMLDFDSGTADRVVDALIADVSKVEADLLMIDRFDRGRKRLTRLVSSLERLREPYANFLQNLLAPHPGGEAFPLARVHVTGRLDDAGGVEPVFSRGLTRHAFFVETGRGRPTARRMAATRRRVHRAQAALAVSVSAFALVAWQQGASLSWQASVAEDSVRTLRRELTPSGPLDASAILPAVAALGDNRLATPAIPFSLASSVDQDNRRLAILAIRRLIVSQFPDARADTGAGLDGQGQLAAQLGHVQRLRDQIERYERFRLSRSMADLAALVGDAVPTVDDGLIKEAIAGMDLPAVDPLPVTAEAERETLRLADDMARSMFGSAPVRARITALSKSLQALEAAVKDGGMTGGAIRPVIQDAEALKATLAHPNEILQAAADRRLPGDIKDMLDRMGPTASAVTAMFIKAAADLEAEMLAAEAPLAGPLVVRTQDAPGYAPSPSLTSLASAVDALAAQAHLAEAEPTDPSTDPVEALGGLRQVIIAHRSMKAAQPLPEALGRAADLSFGRYLQTRLQRFLNGPIFTVDGADFLRSASSIVKEVAAGARPYLEPAARAELDRALDSRATALLERADAFLKTRKPFDMVADAAANWTGETGAMRRAFAVADGAALSAKLSETRGLILDGPGADARAAADLMAASAAADAKLAARSLRWREIMEPSSGSIEAMERFVLQTDAMDAATCQNTLKMFKERVGDDTAGDPIAATLSKARAGFANRCSDLAKVARREEPASTPAPSASSALASLGAAFAPLENRFPFVGPRGGIDAPDVAPRDVRRFLQVFDQLRTQALEEAAGGGRRKSVEIRLFVDQIEAARPLLESLMPMDRNPEPIAVEFDYGINRMAEVGGGEIIDWSIRSGGSAVGPGSASRVMRWSPGEPLLVSFRWASGSRYRPRRDEGYGTASVRDDTITIVERGPWALLRLIRLRGMETAGLAAPSAGGAVIRVALPTRTVSGAPAPDTVVFVGARIMAGNGSKSFGVSALPSHFPG
ncbi:hypothetical protein N825_33860 [Skermanella stibiiresistens SB22]|uniref:Type VI secretion system component TssM1 N-terminal domain-containing protein n=1 Tax=Skermanella stibiiresistens SB22 TaxID=1385369 RepID=W9H3Z5_9PROT|nr:type VI secretion protein IcmF/TssM N-terminal domain-containing protein [Skermanella stibiiresistens]EWY40920.1 hypothetical protein N825_33860 [Skermanella stibiiresistens SB22]